MLYGKKYAHVQGTRNNRKIQRITFPSQKFYYLFHTVYILFNSQKFFKFKGLTSSKNLSIQTD